MSTVLFIYGTLHPDRAPAEIAAAARRLTPHGPATIRGHLYDLGEYPGVGLDPTAPPIPGHLFAIPDAATLAALDADVDVDVVLMAGVGAANAGELVVRGRGVAFVCLEHFTSVANPDTAGLGLEPELIPMWLAHEIAHAIRYTSPTSRSEMAALIRDAGGGEYSYWETGRHATLRELLLNEGLAVHVARAISPGHAAWEYFGYGRRQYARVRELETIIHRTAGADLDRSGLGLRLRYLSGGVSDEARTVDHYVLPERSGYWLGARLAEPAVAARGLAWAVRAGATEIAALSETAAVTA